MSLSCVTLIFMTRHHNYIKILDLLAAISRKKSWNSLRVSITRKTRMPRRYRTEPPSQLCQRISCRSFMQTLKNRLAYSRRGWFGNPPTTRRRLPVAPTCFQRVLRIHRMRKVSFADWRSPTFLEMRIWQWEWSACRSRRTAAGFARG